MSNPLTSGEGVTSGQGENSSSAPGVLNSLKQQEAISDANMARQRAELAAVEAANAAARKRPAQNNMSNTLDAGDFGIPFGVTSAAKPTRRVVGKKGK